MRKGDLVLFYHSNADPPGVAGIASVHAEAHPDVTAFNRRSRYFDEKSTKDEPRWWLVDIAFEEKLARLISLTELKEDPRFEGMMATQRGARLSVQPVEKKHFDLVRKLGRK